MIFSKILIKNISTLTALAAIFLSLFLAYPLIDNKYFDIFLIPLKSVLQLIWQTEAIRQAPGSYIFPSIGISIDKSCSGYHLWLLTFVIMTIPPMLKFQNTRNKFIAIPTFLLLAFPLSLTANIVRIACSRFIQLKADLFLGNRPHYFIHELTGTMINLILLTLTYYLVYIMIKKFRYEKNT